MKYFALTVSLLWCCSAFAQSAPVFAPNGEYLGTAVKNGSTTVFVDKNGQYGGAVVQNKNGTAYFDKNGYRGVRPNGYGQRPYGQGGYDGRPNGYSNRPYGNRPQAYGNGYGPNYGYGGRTRRTPQNEDDWGW